jgi:hypothetical protein
MPSPGVDRSRGESGLISFVFVASFRPANVLCEHSRRIGHDPVPSGLSGDCGDHAAIANTGS